MLQRLKRKLQSLAMALLVTALLVSGNIMPAGVVQAINTPWLTTSGRFIKDPSGNIVILPGFSLVEM